MASSEPAHDDQPVAYHVSLRFRPGPAGVTGTWADGAVAEGKFTGFVGTYGSVAGIQIQLLAEFADGTRSTVETWPKEPPEASSGRSGE